ncbi:MAG: M23 family metallopeptidase [Nannocystales bacterium]
MPPRPHHRRTAPRHLVWLCVLSCGGDPDLDGPSSAASPDVGPSKPEPDPEAELPPPPSDPWAAEGLSALRNGDDLGWPVESVHVTSSFGWRLDPVAGAGTRMHKGTDFRGNVGDLVLSVARGEVRFVGIDPALGTMVIVDHGLGITSLYGHLSDVLVWPGASVDRGAALGLVGNTGRSAAPHLHLTMKIDDVAVDPMMLLGQPLHRATALRSVPPRTRAPVEETQAAQQDPQAAPVLQP